MFKLFKKKEKIKRELPPGTIRKEFHFEGNVQNIGFRFEVQSHAMPLGITGYAKNNDDGSVTAQLQGSLKNINKVILDLQNIDRIQIDFISEKDIPLDYYEKTMRKMDEAKSILDGLEDAKSGNTVDGDTAISNIRSKYGV